LSNVPVGKGITLVIQMGRWRRLFQVDVSNSCAANAVADKTLLMPSTHLQGDIPLTAIVTGQQDSIECVFRKMGIADSEFTDPSGGGRIHFYAGADQTGSTNHSGQVIDGSTPAQSGLFATVNGSPVIDNYDMVVLSCQGAARQQSTADQATLYNYANGGGRVFGTHFSYTWFNNNADFATTAKWHADAKDGWASLTGLIDFVSNPKAGAFQAWLQAVGASPAGPGTVPVVVTRHSTDGVLGNTQQWLYRDGNCPTANLCNGGPNQGSGCLTDADCGSGNTCTPNPGACSVTDYSGMSLPLHFTFNTPVNPAPGGAQCGRALFSDFHVSDASTHGVTFPKACDSNPMNAQEKLLEYMIFDLGACVQPYKPACTPLDCAAQGIQCGMAGDGCGNAIDCKQCANNQICGGSGKPGVCGSQACLPTSCTAQGIQCGLAGDGCGNQINCGNCPTGEICGAGGPGKCAAPIIK
jgi:hypothetical protein